MISNRQKSLWASLDWASIVMYILLIVAGWFSICGATYSFDMDKLFEWGSRPVMQLLWMGLALVIGFAVLMINPEMIKRWTPLFYLVMLGLCLVTIFVAPDIKGSRSWLVIGPVRLQPAEFTKVATALLLSWRCSQYGFEIGSIRSYIELFAIVFIPILLILAQSETGSALVFFALFLALYREGFTGLFMGLGVSAAIYFISALILDGVLWWGETTSAGLFFVANAILVISLMMFANYHRDGWGQALRLLGIALLLQVIALFVHGYLPFDLAYVPALLLALFALYLIYLAVREYAIKYLLLFGFVLASIAFFFSTNYIFHDILEPHQQVRIRVALGIESDPRGNGYNVDQAKIAIGSGGLMGKGFLGGTQSKLSYVPEQDTDFIFCTVGEEQGFLGTTLLLAFYTLFILRLAHLAERQTNTFARVYGYCIAAIFFFHLFVNVGMVIGLVPVIGIPLPFFSYGGSSLWGFSFMLFIFLGMDARRHNRHL